MKNKAQPATIPPTTNPTNAVTLGLKSIAPPFGTANKTVFFRTELVLPNFSLSTPECPFEVANTADATLAVFLAFEYAVVENVFVARLIEIYGS